MDLNYINIPTDYVTRLHQDGEREKARAFMEYFFDMQNEQANSVRFYGKSWGSWERGNSLKPKSNSVVTNWIEEFTDEIDRFYAAWSLKNMQFNARVKNSSAPKQKERQKNAKRTPKTPTKPTKKQSCEPKRTLKERQKNEDYNIYDDDRAIAREFENLFFIYRAFNGNYTGKKADGLEAYSKVQNDVEYEDMIRCIKLYLSDSSVEKKNGIAKFFDDAIYLTYSTKRVSIFVDGEWLDGMYGDEKFITDTGEEMILSSDGFARFFADGKLKLLDVEDVA